MKEIQGKLSLVQVSASFKSARVDCTSKDQYSGTPPYDHPVYKTTSLLRPYSFKPNVKNIDSFYYFEDPVNATTSLLRPGFYGPAVVVLTGLHCKIHHLVSQQIPNITIQSSGPSRFSPFLIFLFSCSLGQWARAQASQLQNSS